MCYFLYGAVNDGINADDYNKVIKNTGFYFRIGDTTAVNECVAGCDSSYRITRNHCDCHTAEGQKHTHKNELKELRELLLNLQNVRGIRYVLISKNWVNETNNKQETVHIQDIDVLCFFADMEDNCLYRIDLYKKYY